MHTITTEELLQRIENPEVKIIDNRSADAYNGWRERDELRGGHVKGAKSLPYKWNNYIDWIEIIRTKEFGVQDELIIYGYDVDQTNKTAELLMRAGYTNVVVYHRFVEEWSKDRSKPIEQLARYRHLISAP